MYVTLYRKYRPKNFEEVYGENGIVRAIKNSLRENKLPHAYLFTGPRGVGKTTIARLIAKGLNCMTNGITDSPCNKCEACKEIDSGNFFDLIEIDAASNRGIDEIRDLKEKINYQPVKGRKKVYIIDEVHMLTKEAFNALLKTLEEPPAHVIFILATTEPDKILDTIISRCQRYDFSAVTIDDIAIRIKEIATIEGITIDDGSLRLIYEKSGGSMRDAVSIFEKVVSYTTGNVITEPETQKALGVTPESVFIDFTALIQNKNIKSIIEFVDKVYYSGIKIEEFFKDYASYLKETVINNKNTIPADKIIYYIETIYETLNRFRYEENKKLVSFVIISKFGKNSDDRVVSEIKDSNEQVYIKSSEEKVVKKDKNTELDSSVKKETGASAVSIEAIKQKWGSVIEKVKEQKISSAAFLNFGIPLKIEANILHIGFKYEYLFHKISIEKKENREILVDVLEQLFNRKIDIKCELIGDKIKKEEHQGDMTKKVIEFFGGDVIEIK